MHFYSSLIFARISREFSLHCVRFKLFCVRQGVFRKSCRTCCCTPEITTIAALPARGKVCRKIGKYQRALNQMQIELARRAVGNFQFSPLARFSAAAADFPTVWGCRKNKLELIFCPHGLVFHGAPHWEEPRAEGVGFSTRLCVYAFNYFPAAEVLFPIITRAFFDVEIITHTHARTHRHRYFRTFVILWVIFKLYLTFFFLEKRKIRLNN